MKQLDIVAAVLVVVGALNWGLVAVARSISSPPCSACASARSLRLSAVVYGLVGLAGVYQALFWKRVQSRWAHPAARALVNPHINQRRSENHVEDLDAWNRDRTCIDGVGVRARRRPVAAKDIVDTAVAAGSFKTLAKALEAADLVEHAQGRRDRSRCSPRPTRRSPSCRPARSRACSSRRTRRSCSASSRITSWPAR